MSDVFRGVCVWSRSAAQPLASCEDVVSGIVSV